MDFQSIVADMVLDAAGDFLLNFTSKKVKVEPVKRRFTLSKLQLKRQALAQLGIPLDILCSEISSVTVNLKHMSLFGTQVTVDIDGVFLVVAPATSDAAAAASLSKSLHLAADELQHRVAHLLKKLVLKSTSAFTAAAQSSAKTMRVQVSRTHVRYVHGDGVQLGLVVPFLLFDAATSAGVPLSMASSAKAAAQGAAGSDGPTATARVPEALHRRVLCMSEPCIYVHREATGGQEDPASPPLIIPSRHGQSSAAPHPGSATAASAPGSSRRFALPRPPAGALLLSMLRPHHFTQAVNGSVPRRALPMPEGSQWDLRSDLSPLTQVFQLHEDLGQAPAEERPPSPSTAGGPMRAAKRIYRAVQVLLQPPKQHSATAGAPESSRRPEAWPAWFQPTHRVAAIRDLWPGTFLVEPIDFLCMTISISTSEEASPVSSVVHRSPPSNSTTQPASAADGAPGTAHDSAAPSTHTVRGIHAVSQLSRTVVNMSGADAGALLGVARGWLGFLAAQQASRQWATGPSTLQLARSPGTSLRQRVVRGLCNWGRLCRQRAFIARLTANLGALYIPLYLRRLASTEKLHMRIKTAQAAGCLGPAHSLAPLADLAPYSSSDLFRHAGLPPPAQATEDVWWVMSSLLSGCPRAELSSADPSVPKHDPFQHALQAATWLEQPLKDPERLLLVWLEAHPMVPLHEVRNWRMQAAAMVYSLQTKGGIPASSSTLPSAPPRQQTDGAPSASFVLDKASPHGVARCLHQPGFAVALNLLSPHFAELSLRAGEVKRMKMWMTDKRCKFNRAAGLAVKLGAARKSVESAEPMLAECLDVLFAQGVKPSQVCVLSAPGLQTKSVSSYVPVFEVRQHWWSAVQCEREGGWPAGSPPMPDDERPVQQRAWHMVRIAAALAAGPQGQHSRRGGAPSSGRQSGDSRIAQPAEFAPRSLASTSTLHFEACLQAAVVHFRHTADVRDSSPASGSFSARPQGLIGAVMADYFAPAEAAAGGPSESRPGDVPALEAVTSMRVDPRPCFTSLVVGRLAAMLSLDEAGLWTCDTSASILHAVCPAEAALRRQVHRVPGIQHRLRGSTLPDSGTAYEPTATGDIQKDLLLGDYADGFVSLLNVHPAEFPEDGESSDGSDWPPSSQPATQLHFTVQSQPVTVRGPSPQLADGASFASQWFQDHPSVDKVSQAHGRLTIGNIVVAAKLRPVVAFGAEISSMPGASSALQTLAAAVTWTRRGLRWGAARLAKAPAAGFHAFQRVWSGSFLDSRGDRGCLTAQPRPRQQRGARLQSHTLRVDVQGIALGMRVEHSSPEPVHDRTVEDTRTLHDCLLVTTGAVEMQVATKSRQAFGTSDPTDSAAWWSVPQAWHERDSPPLMSLNLKTGSVRVGFGEEAADPRGTTNSLDFCNLNTDDLPTLQSPPLLSCEGMSCSLSAFSVDATDDGLQGLQQFCRQGSAAAPIAQGRPLATVLVLQSLVQLATVTVIEEGLVTVARFAGSALRHMLNTFADPVVRRGLEQVFPTLSASAALSTTTSKRQAWQSLWHLAQEGLKAFPCALVQHSKVERFGVSCTLRGSKCDNASIFEASASGQDLTFRLAGTTEGLLIASDASSCTASLALSGAAAVGCEQAPHPVGLTASLKPSTAIHLQPRLLLLSAPELAHGLQGMPQEASPLRPPEDGEAPLPMPFAHAVFDLDRARVDLNVLAESGSESAAMTVPLIQETCITSRLWTQYHPKARRADPTFIPRGLPAFLGDSQPLPPMIRLSRMLQASPTASFVTDKLALVGDRIPRTLSDNHYFGLGVLAETYVAPLRAACSISNAKLALEVLAHGITSAGVVLSVALKEFYTSVKAINVELPDLHLEDDRGGWAAPQELLPAAVNTWRSLAFAVDVTAPSMEFVLLSDDGWANVSRQLLLSRVSHVELRGQYGASAEAGQVPVLRGACTVASQVLAGADAHWTPLLDPCAMTVDISYSSSLDDAAASPDLQLNVAVAFPSLVAVTLTPTVVLRGADAARSLLSLVRSVPGLLARAHGAFATMLQPPPPSAVPRTKGTQLHAIQTGFEPFFFVNALGVDMYYFHQNPRLRADKVLVQGGFHPASHGGGAAAAPHLTTLLACEPQPQPLRFSIADATSLQHQESLQGHTLQRQTLDVWSKLSLGDTHSDRADRSFGADVGLDVSPADAILQNEASLHLRIPGYVDMQRSFEDVGMRLGAARPTVSSQMPKASFLWQVQRVGEAKVLVAASLVRLVNHCPDDLPVHVQVPGRAEPLSFFAPSLSILPLPFMCATATLNASFGLGAQSGTSWHVSVPAHGASPGFLASVHTKDSLGGHLNVFLVQKPCGQQIVKELHVLPPHVVMNALPTPLDVQVQTSEGSTPAFSVTLGPGSSTCLPSARPLQEGGVGHVVRIRLPGSEWSPWRRLRVKAAGAAVDGGLDASGVAPNLVQPGAAEETLTRMVSETLEVHVDRQSAPEAPSSSAVAHLLLQRWQRLPAGCSRIPQVEGSPGMSTVVVVAAPVVLQNATGRAVEVATAWPDDISIAREALQAPAHSADEAIALLCDMAAQTRLVLQAHGPGSMGIFTPLRFSRLQEAAAAQVPFFAGPVDHAVAKWMGTHTGATCARFRCKSASGTAAWTLSPEGQGQHVAASLYERPAALPAASVDLANVSEQLVTLPLEAGGGLLPVVVHSCSVPAGARTYLSSLCAALQRRVMLSPRFVLKNSSTHSLLIAQAGSASLPDTFSVEDVASHGWLLLRPSEAEPLAWHDADGPQALQLAVVAPSSQAGDSWTCLTAWSAAALLANLEKVSMAAPSRRAGQRDAVLSIQRYSAVWDAMGQLRLRDPVSHSNLSTAEEALSGSGSQSWLLSLGVDVAPRDQSMRLDVSSLSSTTFLVDNRSSDTFLLRQLLPAALASCAGADFPAVEALAATPLSSSAAMFSTVACRPAEAAAKQDGKVWACGTRLGLASTLCVVTPGRHAFALPLSIPGQPAIVSLGHEADPEMAVLDLTDAHSLATLLLPPTHPRTAGLAALSTPSSLTDSLRFGEPLLLRNFYTHQSLTWASPAQTGVTVRAPGSDGSGTLELKQPLHCNAVALAAKAVHSEPKDFSSAPKPALPAAPAPGPAVFGSCGASRCFFVALTEDDVAGMDLHSVHLAAQAERPVVVQYGCPLLVCSLAHAPRDASKGLDHWPSLQQTVMVLKSKRNGEVHWVPLPLPLRHCVEQAGMIPATDMTSASRTSASFSVQQLKDAAKCIMVLSGGDARSPLRVHRPNAGGPVVSEPFACHPAYFARRVLHAPFEGASESANPPLQCTAEPASLAPDLEPQLPQGGFWGTPSWADDGPVASTPVMPAEEVQSSAEALFQGAGVPVHESLVGAPSGCVFYARKSMQPQLPERIVIARSGLDACVHSLVIDTVTEDDFSQHIEGSAVAHSPPVAPPLAPVTVAVDVFAPAVQVGVLSLSSQELLRVQAAGIRGGVKVEVPTLLSLLPIDWLLAAVGSWTGSLAEKLQNTLRKALLLGQRSHGGGDSSGGPASPNAGSSFLRFKPAQTWLKLLLGLLRPMLFSMCRQLPRATRASLLHHLQAPHMPGGAADQEGQLWRALQLVRRAPFLTPSIAQVEVRASVADIRVTDQHPEAGFVTVLRRSKPSQAPQDAAASLLANVHYHAASVGSGGSLASSKHVLHVPELSVSLAPLTVQVDGTLLSQLAADFVLPVGLALAGLLSASERKGHMEASDGRGGNAAAHMAWWKAPLQPTPHVKDDGPANLRRVHIDTLSVAAIEYVLTFRRGTERSAESVLAEVRGVLDSLGLPESGAEVRGWAEIGAAGSEEVQTSLGQALLGMLRQSAASAGLAFAPLTATLGALLTTASSVSQAHMALHPLHASGFMTLRSITKACLRHYTTQLVLSMHNVLLNIDVLGRPVHVLRRVAHGTSQLALMPLAGLRAQSVMGTLQGLLGGSASFAGGVVSGVGTAAAAVSSSLGHGVSALTFDREFQSQRTASLRKHMEETQDFQAWLEATSSPRDSHAAAVARVWTLHQLEWLRRHAQPLTLLQPGFEVQGTPESEPGQEDTASVASSASYFALPSLEEGGLQQAPSATLPSGEAQHQLELLQRYAVASSHIAPLPSKALVLLASFVENHPATKSAFSGAVVEVQAMETSSIAFLHEAEEDARPSSTKLLGVIERPSTSSAPLLSGVLHGVAGISQSIVSGAAGVVLQPVRGYRSAAGVSGVVSGLARGVVGMVALPAVGVLDALHSVGEGIVAVGDGRWVAASRKMLAEQQRRGTLERALRTTSVSITRSTASSNHGWAGKEGLLSEMELSLVFRARQQFEQDRVQLGMLLYRHAAWLWLLKMQPPRLTWGHSPPRPLSLQPEHALVLWALRVAADGIPAGIPVSVGHSVWRRLMPALLPATAWRRSQSRKDTKVLRKVKAKDSASPDPRVPASISDAVQACAADLGLVKPSLREELPVPSLVSAAWQHVSMDDAAHSILQGNLHASAEYLKSSPSRHDSGSFTCSARHQWHLILPQTAGSVGDPFEFARSACTEGTGEAFSGAAADVTSEARLDCAPPDVASLALPLLRLLVGTDTHIMLVEYGPLWQVLASPACTLQKRTQHDANMPVMMICWKLPLPSARSASVFRRRLEECMGHALSDFTQTARAEGPELPPTCRLSAPCPFPLSITPQALLPHADDPRPPATLLACASNLLHSGQGALQTLLSEGGLGAREALVDIYFTGDDHTRAALMDHSNFAEAAVFLAALSPALAPQDAAALLAASFDKLNRSLHAAVRTSSGRADARLDSDALWPAQLLLLAQACPQDQMTTATVLIALQQGKYLGKALAAHHAGICSSGQAETVETSATALITHGARNLATASSMLTAPAPGGGGAAE